MPNTAEEAAQAERRAAVVRLATNLVNNIPIGVIDDDEKCKHLASWLAFEGAPWVLQLSTAIRERGNCGPVSPQRP